MRACSYLVVGDNFNGCVVTDVTPEIIWFKKRNGLKLPMPRAVIDEVVTLMYRNKDFDVGKSDGKQLALMGVRLETYFITGYKTIHRNIARTILDRIKEQSNV